MRNFKILVIAHSLKQNKIAKYGETVSESQLTSPAFELVEAGFIKEVFDVNDIITKEAEEVVLIPAEIEEKEVEPVITKEAVIDVKKQSNKK